MYVSVRVHFMCSYLKPAVLPRFSKCTLAICHFLVEPTNRKKLTQVTTAHRENFALAEDVYSIPYFVSHRTTISIHRNTFKDLMNEQIRPDLVTWGQSELYEAIIRFGSYCYCGF